MCLTTIPYQLYDDEAIAAILGYLDRRQTWYIKGERIMGVFIDIAMARGSMACSTGPS